MKRGWIAGDSGPLEQGGVDAYRLLVVRCGPFQFGLPTELVRGVVGAGEIVPLDMFGLEGLLWRDGALLPAVGLNPLLGLPKGAGEVSRHGVLIHSPVGSFCFMVDEALDLIEIPADSIRVLPSLVTRVVRLAGLQSAAMLDRLLLVVDPVEALGLDRVVELVSAAARVGNPKSSEAGQG